MGMSRRIGNSNQRSEARLRGPPRRRGCATVRATGQSHPAMTTALAPDDVVATHAAAAAHEREPLVVTEPLLAFLVEHDLAPASADELAVESLGDGHSNVTLLLRCAGRELVLRRPPRGPLPPSAHDVLREARLLRALAPTAARVPAVLAVGDDPALIGAPFYVMERVAGDVVTTSVPAGARHAGRAPADRRGARRRARRGARRRLAGRGPGGLLDPARGLPRAPAAALRRAVGAPPHARAARRRARRGVAGGAPAGLAGADDRARRLPPRQRHAGAGRAGARGGGVRLGDGDDRRSARRRRLPQRDVGPARRPAAGHVRALRRDPRRGLSDARRARRALRGSAAGAR